MAYRVLVCDDEENVCDLILNLVDWEALALEVIGVVHDGLIALKEIRSKRPDIVITDIRMPNLNGLELIRMAVEEELGARFIVISGYKSFDYAYKAINYGVNNYLLKPIQKKDLENNLLKISNEIENKNSIQHRILRDSVILKQHFLTSVIEGQLENYSLEDLNFRYNLHLQSGALRFAVFQFDMIYPKKREDYGAIMPIIAMAEEMVVEILRETCYFYATVMKNGRIIAFMNYNGSGGMSFSFFRKMMIRIREKLSVSNLYLITLGIGACVSDASQLPYAYKTAEEALKVRLTQGCDRTYAYDPKWEEEPNDRVCTKQEWQAFTEGVECLDALIVSEWIDGYYRTIEDKIQTRPTLLFDATEYLLNEFAAIRKRYDWNITELNIRESLYDGSFSVYDRHRLAAEVREKIVEYIKALRDERERNSCTPILKAKEYMEKHLAEEVSLETVAGYVRLNPVYFSALFKKQTGINFLAYLTSLRMEKAKKYLAQTDLGIADIAEKVGYYDPKYFGKMFKKENHITPAQYRRIHER